MLNYIIVQAGGKGTRLQYLTKNKPKALAPVENLPMLFHLFRKYPDQRFIIIADYKKDVLRKYLAAFAEINYQVVDAAGTGTCAGIRQAIDLIPEKEPFMLIWSDLILPEGFELPEEQMTTDRIGKPPLKDYVGLSETFPCRWKYENGMFEEERSTQFGVAGFFLLHEKSVLSEVPESGELVRWFKDRGIHFETLSLAGTREFGILAEYEKLTEIKTRPFNRITFTGDVVIKETVDEQGRKLAVRESAWYEKAKDFHIAGIPEIYEMSPLKMERIRGRNIYECDLPYEDKYRILKSLVKTLNDLHAVSGIPADSLSLKEAYFNKTMQRLRKVEHLVPFAGERTICVNGRKCRNVFYLRDILEKRLDELKTDRFSFIHGDCTFSNLMLRDAGEPVLIDPRGYFGFTELYGDERYDWAKLYYSIVGNYDRFNLKRFSLDIGGHSVVDGEIIRDLSDGEVRLTIESNGWETLEKDFFDLTEADPYEIRLLHAVIWLSLTTYAWQDYDSICGAFYNGLYYLEEVL
ncbi:MAG: NTP transferase domain-containing protein [Lachnospiraceae bacterium]|nr:NTP transferase domain-containing protein [Lachnospiraceae bacterium]